MFISEAWIKDFTPHFLQHEKVTPEWTIRAIYSFSVRQSRSKKAVTNVWTTKESSDVLQK